MLSKLCAKGAAFYIVITSASLHEWHLIPIHRIKCQIPKHLDKP